MAKAVTPPSLFGIDLDLHMRLGNTTVVECVLVLLKDFLR